MSKTQFKVGDIIRIGKIPVDYAVVESAIHRDLDQLRGDSYSVEQFSAIRLDVSERFYTDHRDEYVFTPMQVKRFYFIDGSMRGAGTGISRDKVKKVGTCTTRKEIEVTYLLSKPVIKSRG